MTLLDAIRCAADEHPRRSRRALTEAQAERVLAVVLEAAERAVLPVVAKSWEGNEVVGVLRALGAESRTITAQTENKRCSNPPK